LTALPNWDVGDDNVEAVFLGYRQGLRTVTRVKHLPALPLERYSSHLNTDVYSATRSSCAPGRMKAFAGSNLLAREVRRRVEKGDRIFILAAILVALVILWFVSRTRGPAQSSGAMQQIEAVVSRAIPSTFLLNVKSTRGAPNSEVSSEQRVGLSVTLRYLE
jgi:hypothetical protein